MAHELADGRHEDAAPLKICYRSRRSARTPTGGFAAPFAPGKTAGPGYVGGWLMDPGAHAAGGPLLRPRSRSVAAARRTCQTIDGPRSRTNQGLGGPWRPPSVFVGGPGDGLRGCLGEVGDVRILVILVARASVAEERIDIVVGLVATGDGGGQGEPCRLVVRRTAARRPRGTGCTRGRPPREPRRRGPRGPPDARAPCGPRRSSASPSRPG